MKKLIIILMVAIAGIGIFSSCQNILDSDSDRLIFNYDLSSEKDTVYSVIGLYSRLQNLSVRYILVGELRADLMDVTSQTVDDVRELSEHNISDNNPYVSTREYYEIINNCNYYLKNMDPSIVVQGEKLVEKEYAAVKVLRAWVYYQLVMNYGKAVYLEQPILSVDDAFNKDYPVYDIDQMFRILIDDIDRYKNILSPNYVGRLSPRMFISGKILLGDMNLWLGNFATAADLYRSYLYDNRLVVGTTYASSWSDVTFRRKNDNFRNIFTSVKETTKNIEIQTIIWNEEDTPLTRMTRYSNVSGYYQICPSKKVIQLWNEQNYVYPKSTNSYPGDLRGEDNSYKYDNDMAAKEHPYILKYMNSGGTPILYRTGMIYLRLAETLNRLNKPSAAMAVLNYGLSNSTKSKISSWEMNPRPGYLNFDDSRFDGNVGIRYRGLGDGVVNFPANLTDSVAFVDNCLRDEYALETAFEGTRFQDLMRMAHLKNDPSFLADAVGLRSTALRSRLMNSANWFLPTPK